ncbi:MAG: Na+/H+ antiporter NhaC family protein [Candidatus Krumholzibacteriia bacterium]
MNRRTALFCLTCLACLVVPAARTSAGATWQVTAPAVVLAGIPTEVGAEGPPDRFPVILYAAGARDTLTDHEDRMLVRLHAGEDLQMLAPDGTVLAAAQPRILPGWTAILPPLLAIVLALLTRQVLVSLVLGGWFGCLLLEGWQPLAALLRLGDRFLVEALAQPDHASIVLFTTILGGMVGVMARGGLTEGVVQALVRRVGGRRGGQLSTAAMGTVIFFDDYANTLLVGTTMRPLTDQLRISREKLSYLVDSTAAPVATLAVISTWVGFEVGLIQDALAGLGSSDAAYTFFLRTLPYSFYPWLTLLCVYLIAGTGRDFGPMLAAERRASATGAVLRPGARPASESLTASTDPGGGTPVAPVHPVLGLLPVLTVVATTAVGLVVDGRRAAMAAGAAEPGLREILGQANSFAVLMWAAIMGTLAALAVVVAMRRLDLKTAVDGFVDGCRAMLIAVTILLLAWSLGAVCQELNTAGFLVEACRGALSARLLPAVTFVLAAAVSFATGTSWGTMAILMPLVFPLGAILPGSEGLAAGTALGIHLASTSAVLAGAVFGDHCSPISDTTIMSSLASGSDHVDHVRTQLPYALTVGLLALICGYLPAGFGAPAWVGLATGAVLLAAVVLVCGRRVEAAR